MFEADVVCQRCGKKEKLGYDYCSCPRCGAWMIARTEPMMPEASRSNGHKPPVPEAPPRKADENASQGH